MKRFTPCILALALLGCAAQPAPAHWCRAQDEARSRDYMTYEGTMIPLKCDWRNSTLPEHTMRQIEFAATEAGDEYMTEHPQETPSDGAKWTGNAYHAAAKEWRHLCQVEDLGPYCYQGILP